MMSGCSPWHYANVTSQVFQALQAKGRQQGFAIPKSPSGGFTVQTAEMKIHFRYAWNKSSSSLQLECINKPQLLSCSMIKSFADRIVTQCGGRPL